MALTEAAREAIHLRRLLEELGADRLCEGPTTIFCDNQGANELTRNPVHHSRTKHIDIRHHYIREVYQQGAVNVEYMPSTQMPADVLTKALGGNLHLRCTQGLGLNAE